MKLRLTKSLSSLLALAASVPAVAQDYPTKQITMAIPFAAGGPTDTLGRNLAGTMTQFLKQQIIIENVAGAGGTIATNRVAKAKPDGYNLLLHHIGMSTAPALYRKLPFNPLTDFEYIGQVADVPMTVVAKLGLPPDNLTELIAYVKKNKEKLNLGNAGLGAASHLCGLLFMSRIEANIQTIPYNGTAPAMAALMGGQIDLMCDQTTNTTQQIKSGRIKVYGATTAQRIPSLAMVPTLTEQGLKGFEVSVWHGVYAPKGTPKPVADKLVAALQHSVQDANFKSRLAELGAQPVSKDKATPDSLAKHLKAEIEKWRPIIQKAGQYAD